MVPPQQEQPSRLAVVLFNLGGPDALESVQPFLRNLFSDPAILPVPAPIRKFLAYRIAAKRAPAAREIYRQIGGKSPLLEATTEQARCLEDLLKQQLADRELRVFVAMRYWHPRAEEVVAEVKSFEPEEVILLPLYPQYSTTTTQSSIDEWKREATAQKLVASTKSLCCYPTEPGLVEAFKLLLEKTLKECPQDQPLRVLFSAHGLPKSIVDGGDPYQFQVEKSVEAIVRALNRDQLDYRICYQSRVTNREWLGPATEDEILLAGSEGIGLVVVPIAFVSEHSETLVELDIEYRELAERSGVPFFQRTATPGAQGNFIQGLANLVISMARGGANHASLPMDRKRFCDTTFKQCPCTRGLLG